MFASNAAPITALDDARGRRSDLLEAVIERAEVVAAVTTATGVLQWASPAFLALAGGDGDALGESLFALAGGRYAVLAPVLHVVLEAPSLRTTAEVSIDGPAPRVVRIEVENRCDDPAVRGVLWWQCRTDEAARIDRLTHALVNIAREVEWVGVGLRREVAAPAPIGLLPGSEQLSDRERAVATMLAQGESVSSIAARLYVSPSTVRNYLSAMYRKLRVRDLPALRELLARGTGTAEQRVAALSPVNLDVEQ